MEDTVSESVEQLRKRSRTLLAQVDENIKRLNNEIRKHRSENSLLNQNCVDVSNEKVANTKKSLRSWKLRNDSTAISRVLCPDYSSPSSNDISASMPDILPSRNIVLRSNKGNKCQWTENLQWKPVKGCYCNTVLNKTQQKSTKRHQKYEDVCDQFKHRTEFCSVQRATAPGILTPPISCETLRRVQKIDYTPKSQFLRNVQSKVSQLQNLPMDSPLEGCVRSSCYHKVMAENEGDTGQCRGCYNDIKKIRKRTDNLGKSRVPSQVPANADTSEDDENTEYQNPAKSSREIYVPSRKQTSPRFIIKKTLTSKKSVPELKKEKSIVRTPRNKRSKEAADCPCCTRSFEKSPRTAKSHSTKVVYYSPTVCKNYDYDEVEEVKEAEEAKEFSKKYFPGNGLRDTKKFREQNYFDTHGSSNTLVSSSSSGSLERCLLNERLFAEPSGRIHSRDLVVTVPSCATVQRKRMHYFPRYVVRQNKTEVSKSHKKRRCQTCPLTGHAIDLGVLKTQPPINSLALKYQKHIS